LDEKQIIIGRKPSPKLIKRPYHFCRLFWRCTSKDASLPHTLKFLLRIVSPVLWYTAMTINGIMNTATCSQISCCILVLLCIISIMLLC